MLTNWRYPELDVLPFPENMDACSEKSEELMAQELAMRPLVITTLKAVISQDIFGLQIILSRVECGVYNLLLQYSRHFLRLASP